MNLRAHLRALAQTRRDNLRAYPCARLRSRPPVSPAVCPIAAAAAQWCSRATARRCARLPTRWHLALSGDAGKGFAAVPAGAAHVRGSLVLPPSRRQSRCTARAFAQMLWHRRIVSGGSTLTMQVARILEPHSRSVGGKLAQILRALQLEAHLSKREILTLYLNRAPFGGTIEGVEAASWAYLGKPASRLSHAEAALLAVLPQSPSRLRPDRNARCRARRARQGACAHGGADVWSAASVRDATHRTRRRTLTCNHHCTRRCSPNVCTRRNPMRAASSRPSMRTAACARSAGRRLSGSFAGTHVRGAAGRRQRHSRGAGLRRLRGVRRRVASGSCRHGARLALARLHAQAVSVRTRARRRPD